jgi:hypothetical protein
MTGRKKVRQDVRKAGGLLPFPRTGCVLHAYWDVTSASGSTSSLRGRSDRTCSVRPVVVQWADDARRPKLLLAGRFEFPDGVWAPRLPKKRRPILQVRPCRVPLSLRGCIACRLHSRPGNFREELAPGGYYSEEVNHRGDRVWRAAHRTGCFGRCISCSTSERSGRCPMRSSWTNSSRGAMRPRRRRLKRW